MAQSFLYANPGKLSIVINHKPISFSIQTGRALLALLPGAIRQARAGARNVHTVDNLTIATEDQTVAISQPAIERVALLSLESASALMVALPRYIRTAEHMENGLFLQLTPVQVH